MKEKMISVRLNENQLTRLKTRAALEYKSVSKLVEMLIDVYLDQPLTVHPNVIAAMENVKVK